jgi:hypothetical protein
MKAVVNLQAVRDLPIGDLANLGLAKAGTTNISELTGELTAFQKARLGKITGSQFHRIRRDRSGKNWSDGAESYMSEIIFEWITGLPALEFSGNNATEWGEKHESEAIQKYQYKTGRKVERGEFYQAKKFFKGLVGCTPDGVGERGLEVKCPYGPKAHITTLISHKVPEEYKDQVYGHMLCTGRDWCDFVSYDPRMKRMPDLEMVVIEVEKNSFYMEDLEARLYEFEEELIRRLDILDIDWRKGIEYGKATISI